MTTTTAARPNTYAGVCSECGNRVAAGAGLLGSKVDGRWTVRHAECEPEVQTFRSARGVVYTVGMTRRPVHRAQRHIDRRHSAEAWALYGIDE